VLARAGRGLDGDRYAMAAAHEVAEPGSAVTLIESEALDAASREAGCVLEPADSRRNLLTRGVRLNDLVGREFQVGAVRLRGVEPCDPCAHLARLAGKPILRSLVNRGGLRADILSDGMIRIGDPIE
jgi:MOSC domain-containing protein YiiM